MRKLTTIVFAVTLFGILGLQLGCGDSTITKKKSSSVPGTKVKPKPTPAKKLPAANVLNVLPTDIKTFQFSWTESLDADFYQLKESNDGVIFSNLGYVTTDLSFDYSVFLPSKINASYKISACNSVGCVDSNVVAIGTQLVSAIGFVKASNTTINNHFGGSIALSADGQTLAVGAYGEFSSATGVNGNQADQSAAFSGAVYVFVKSGSTWIQQAYVKASNTQGGDQFGSSVSLSSDGNTLAVGAFVEGSNATGINGNQANNSMSASGAVYVFFRTGTTWAQEAYVKASNTQADDYFGISVSLSGDGNTLAVGANQEDSNATGINGNQANNSALNSGAVYVFERSGSVWTQQAYIKASNADEADAFGSSLSFSFDGNTLAIGAIGEKSNSTGVNGNQNNNSMVSAGAVYVFTRVGIIWSQESYIKASNPKSFSLFGTSISLSADGNVLAVSAIGESSNATGINGDQTDVSAGISGAVYLFERAGTVWAQQVYIKASNTQSLDYFGASISLSGDGNTLAVGAKNEKSLSVGLNGDQFDNSFPDAGAVYVFHRNGTTWDQQAYVKAPNTYFNDKFGGCIALSSDGKIMAVAADGQSGISTGINGDQTDHSSWATGAVYLY